MKKIMAVMALAVIFTGCAGSVKKDSSPVMMHAPKVGIETVQEPVRDEGYVYSVGNSTVYSTKEIARDRALLNAVSHLCSMGKTAFIGEIGRQVEEIPLSIQDANEMKTALRDYTTKTGQMLLNCGLMPKYERVWTEERIDDPSMSNFTEREAHVTIRMRNEDFQKVWSNIGDSFKSELAKNKLMKNHRQKFDERIEKIKKDVKLGEK